MVCLLPLLSFILLAVYSLATLATPIGNVKTAITSELLATFNLMEQYAAAAYCPNNHNSPGDKVICKSGSCPLVQAANTRTLIEFESKLSTDVTGYVAVDETNKLVVTSFRGSSTIENWLTNLAFDFVNTDLCSGCTAHHGFWQSWVDSRDGVLAAIKNVSDTYSGYQLVATGHSLGGAIATLAAAELRKDGYDVALYTFGAPRIAGSKLSDFITNQAGGNFRITHWNDPVPRLPPIAMRYVHISPEYYINKPNGQTVNPSDFRIYNGNINLGGNSAWILTDIGAHLWYFNSIAQCSI